MAKSVSADTLLKRLQKIQRAQARLGDITTRIRAQADALAELLDVAQGFVAERPAAKPATRTRSTARARKRTTAGRSAVQRGSAPPAAATARAARPGTPTRATRRTPPRKPASA
jgi:hypothetical protein